MSLDDIEFVVFGRPAQKGSKRAFVTKGGRAVVVDDNQKKLRNWEASVAATASASMEGRDVTLRAVMMRANFYFCRPKSHYGTGKNSGNVKDSAPLVHCQKPDLDKLLRALSDALTGVVWRDDSQITNMVAARHWTTQQERVEVKIIPTPGNGTVEWPEYATARLFEVIFGKQAVQAITRKDAQQQSNGKK